MGAEALVTALMPVWAYHDDYVRRAAASLVDQTSPWWRLVVVAEEAEAEGLADVLAEFLEDERIRLVVNEGRKLAGAINTGMRAAATDHVAILLGDDMWAPAAVEVLADHIERLPQVDFFHSSRVIVDGEDQPISRVYRAREAFTLEDFMRGSPVKHLLCWRRATALEIGGLDETLNSVGPDDYDFPWSMAEAGARFMAIPDCLYLYRDHRDSFRLTTHLPLTTHVRELRRILEKHGVDQVRIHRALARARAGYLRQCLYRSRVDRWVKERRGYDPSSGWRENYGDATPRP
jgi:glycosyltransferase involved in cell wall biosynthesis